MIVNPRAGRMRPKFSLANIADMFAENNMELAIYLTSADYGADLLVKEHEKECDIIACYGGDGTVSEIISGMMECGTKKPFGYIPAGTTNDLARSLKLPTNPIKAAKTIISGDVSPLDVGSFDDGYFVYIASFGAFTEVSYSTPQKFKNIFGHAAYIVNAAKYMNKLESHHMSIETENQQFEGDYVFGAVTNSTSVGGIFKFDSDFVNFSDGKYEVMLIKKPKSIATAVAILSSMINRSFKHKNIKLFHASSIKITSDTPIDWSVDGEHKIGGNTVVIKNNPRSVNIISRKNKNSDKS